MRKLLLLGGLAACHTTPAFYVANVYQANNQLYIERCALDETRHGDVANPDNCRIVPVGELPPGAVPIQGVADDGSAPPAAPPAPPAPPPPSPQ